MYGQHLMRRVLGRQWEQLPASLRTHYQAEANTDTGELDIEYPAWMQPCLNLLRLVGALLNLRGQNIPTTVQKYMRDDIQYWRRELSPANGRRVMFTSSWHYQGEGELIEYINPVFGLRMSVYVRDGKLYYEGRSFVLRIGKLKINIPEWLLLGHTTIVEWSLGKEEFAMDFRLRHPLLGQVYRYAGTFRTVPGHETGNGGRFNRPV